MTTLSPTRIHKWIADGVLGDGYELVGSGHRRPPWTRRERQALEALSRVSTDFQQQFGTSTMGAPSPLLAELWDQLVRRGRDCASVAVGTISVVVRLADVEPGNQ